MKKIFSLLIMACVFCSCMTTMHVNVDVLDRYAVERSGEYAYFMKGRCQLPNLADSATTDSLVRRIKPAIKSVLEKARAGATDNALTAMGKEVVDSLSALFKRGLLNGCAIDSDVDRIIKNILSGFDIYNGLAASQQKDMRHAITDSTKKAVYEMIAYGNSIADDPLASLVAKLPEKYWSKYDKQVNILQAGDDRKSRIPARVNKTKVCTFFGNADIAIKMDAPAYFIIKGVRVDADQAFKATFTVLNQGIKYLAYSRGVPVQNPGGGASSGGSVVAIPELQTKDSLQLKLSQQTVVNKKELAALLNVLFGQSDLLKHASDTSGINNALSSIQTAYTVYKDQVQ